MVRLLSILGLLIGAGTWALVAGEPDIDSAISPSADSMTGMSESRVRQLAYDQKTCCKILKVVLGDKTFLDGASYTKSLLSYWSAQEATVQPSCVFIPQTTKDVAVATFVLGTASKFISCPFAVRGGGHTPWANAANIKGGVTIDTQGLSQVTLSQDRTFVSVGPGNKWGEVYSKLDEVELTTSGGRVSTVGVAGLTLGGGISFFSPRHGLVCDNVINYETVLANGKIVNVNASSEPQLFRALKGGSNNFGIVTRFDLKVFPQGKFWGGFLINPIQVKDTFFTLFENFARSEGYDPYAALIASFSFNPLRGGWTIASNLEYTKLAPNPPVFQPFTNLPQIYSTMRVSNLTDFTVELAADAPQGIRDVFATATFKNSAKMMSRFYDLANLTTASIADVQGIIFSLSFQPLPQAVIAPGFRTTAGAGNSLGLSQNDGDLVNALLTVQWIDPADDARINKAVRQLFANVEKASRSLATYHPYLYLNYAAEWQKPIQGYGGESVHFLRNVSKVYDPRQVFQKQVPGGFKLPRAWTVPPAGWS